MAKKIKKVYNTKLLYRWSAPLWFTLLFILTTIAPIVFSLFVQVFTFNNGETPNQINTLNLVMNMFNQGNESISAFFASIINPVKEINNIVGMVLEIAFKWVLPILAMIIAFFDVILVIFFLVGLCSGRFHHWKGPFILAMWASVFAILYFGSIIGASIYLNTQLPNIPELAAYTFDYMFAIIYVAVMFVSAVILGIIYAAGFKRREFIPNQEYLDNFIQQMTHGQANVGGYNPQPIIINNNTTQPEPVNQPQQVIAPAPQPIIVNAGVNDKEAKTKVITKIKKIHETEVDQSLKYISGHAYAKNIHLLSATIPEGIDKIGASAFANCVNIKIITIPTSVQEIGYNAFYNCKSLEKIVYAGRKEQWRKIKRGSNWLSKAGTTIVSCTDGAIKVNPFRK